jgi:predicted nucleic acid-binding protein
LRELYANVLLPVGVAEEVARHAGVALDTALAAGWLRRVTPSNRMLVEEIERDLGGRGEAEVIAVAIELGNAVVLVDERAARTYARSRGLQVLGTVGVVVHAKLRRLIPRATPLLDDLRRHGFWLDDATYRRARELAGES